MTFARRPLALVALLAGALLLAACGGDAPGSAEGEKYAEQFISCLKRLGYTADHLPDKHIDCPDDIRTMFTTTVTLDGVEKSRDELATDWNGWRTNPDDMRNRSGATEYHYVVEHDLTIVDPEPTRVVVNGWMGGVIERDTEKFTLPKTTFRLTVSKATGQWRITEMDLGRLWSLWRANS